MTASRPFLSPIRLAWALALAAVATRLVSFAANVIFAIRYPYELDYGEGIVWQQAEMILAGSGYGDIVRYPFIVFHYPPVFHLAASALDMLAPGDWLEAARLVSTFSTVACAGLCAWFVRLASDRDDDRWAGTLLAITFFISSVPIITWSALARVDMIALALSLGGLVAGVRAFDRPRLVVLAALLFVLGLYGRQTMIFAPAALFGTMLLVRPRLALRGIGWSILFGLGIMTAMTALTGGRFVQHIFLYNVNRFSIDQLTRLVDLAFLTQLHHWILVGLSLAFLLRFEFRKSRANSEGGDESRAFALHVSLAYFAFSLLSFALSAKLGSNVNYFIDVIAASAILAGTAAARFARRVPFEPALAKLFPVGALLLIALPAAINIPQAYQNHAGDRLPGAVLDGEVAAMRAATKPIISDDMVLVKKSGKPVIWETAIFTELAWAGMWDERLMLDRIARGEFAFIRTVGSGKSPYDDRYRPDVKATIDRAYPVVVRQGSFYNHYPTGYPAMTKSY